MNTKKKTVWIDKSRKEIPIGEMSIEYLYNITKMIWNNVIAPNHPYGDVIQWSFKAPHTRDYLIKFFNQGMEILMDEVDNKEVVKFVNHVDESLNKAFMPILRDLIEDMHELEEDFGDKN